MEIRLARIDDLDSITAIYNEAIKKTTATFDVSPRLINQQAQWFEEHTGTRYPLYVAELNKVVVGWASLSPWSKRDAFKDTAEISFYVNINHQGKGIGTALMREIISAARLIGFHALLAQITEGSEASIHISRSLGFSHVGFLREVGKKFGKTLDVCLYELLLD